MKRTSREPSELSESLHRQLNSYALAASAAGVGMLALAQNAEAKIVYHPAHYTFKTIGRYPLDLNHDGVTDFMFHLDYHFGPYVYDFSIHPTTPKNLIWGYRTTISDLRFASALSAGVNVHSSLKLGNGRNLMLFCSVSSAHCYGQWFNVQNRYLGLKFYTKGKAHYGWARLTHTLFSNTMLTGYAYETIPNKPIITGKTHGKDVITLQDPSLGHLARGASAMKAWRHKKQ